MSFFSNISKVIRGVQSPYNSFHATPIRAVPNQSSTSSFWSDQRVNHSIHNTRVSIKPSALTSGTIRRAVMNIKALAKGKVK